MMHGSTNIKFKIKHYGYRSDVTLFTNTDVNEI